VPFLPADSTWTEPCLAGHEMAPALGVRGEHPDVQTGAAAQRRSSAGSRLKMTVVAAARAIGPRRRVVRGSESSYTRARGIAPNSVGRFGSRRLDSGRLKRRIRCSHRTTQKLIMLLSDVAKQCSQGGSRGAAALISK
jgi:hypothetical protein